MTAENKIFSATSHISSAERNRNGHKTVHFEAKMLTTFFAIGCIHTHKNKNSYKYVQEMFVGRWE